MTRIIKVKPDPPKTKKLILIGNGFDLALGHKTSYTDFIDFLILREVGKALVNGEKYNGDNRRRGITEIDTWKNSESRNKLFTVTIAKEYFYNKYINKETYLALDTMSDIKEDRRALKYISYDFENRGGIVNLFFYKKKYKWVDIETVFFNLIKEFLPPKKRQEDVVIGIVETLNNELDNIKIELANYLTQYKFKPVNAKQKEAILNQFFATVDVPIEPVYGKRSHMDFFEGEELVLNFNYTNTLAGFRQMNNVINIHGSLEEGDDIIFGYGDEMDREYKTLEEMNENVLLKNIKSFAYFNSNKYRKLQTFIESGPFQVCIYGHSCGISDRVMLNEIFENENCESIRVFYYKDIDDYTQKTMNISRNFNSNLLMRKKVIPFQEDDRIPQYNDTYDEKDYE